MIEDCNVPKEQFLLDYFSKKKQKEAPKSVNFDTVLSSVQLKIERKSLEDLTSSISNVTADDIDAAPPAQVIKLLEQSVDFLKGLNKDA